MYQVAEDDPELAPDERWRLAQRIAHSEVFRRAPRLRAFLLFVVDRAVRNKPSDLTEYIIGTEVFERPASFNPADDSLVRTSARQLRAKLHEYFETEGHQEPRTLEIPKGSYLPEFRDRPGGSAAEVLQPIVRVVSEVAPGATRTTWVLACLCVALALAAGWGWLRAPFPERPRSVPPNLMASVFPQQGLMLNVVMADSALVVVNAFRKETISLDQYIRREEQIPLPLPMAVPGSATPATFPGGRLITSFRDAIFISQLTDLATSRGWKVLVRHSRLMQSRDFGSGNFVLIGSTWSNPWVQMFEQKCNFRFSRDGGTGQFGIGNAAPQPGEKPFYTSTPDQARNGVSHARVVLLPNLSDSGKVLLISGLHTESSEGATAALLAPGLLTQVERLIPGERIDRLKAFELLVEVRSVDGAAHEWSLAAARFVR